MSKLERCPDCGSSKVSHFQTRDESIPGWCMVSKFRCVCGTVWVPGHPPETVDQQARRQLLTRAADASQYVFRNDDGRDLYDAYKRGVVTKEELVETFKKGLG